MKQKEENCKDCKNCKYIYMEYDEETETWIYYCINPNSKYFQCAV